MRMDNKNQVTVNDALTLNYPDGMHVMRVEEKRGLPFLGEGPAEALKDEDRHILITLGWKKVPRLVSFLTDANDAASAIRRDIRKPMAAYGYCNENILSRTITNEKAEGLGYEYTAQGIHMYGESYVIKHEKYFFYFHFYTRIEYKEENLLIWNEMLDSAVL